MAGSAMPVANPRRGAERARTARLIHDSLGLLSSKLRAMERDGLVGRRVHPEVPPRVEYALTPLGATLAGPLRALGAWSVAHGKHVEEARGRFEERAARKNAA